MPVAIHPRVTGEVTLTLPLEEAKELKRALATVLARPLTDGSVLNISSTPAGGTLAALSRALEAI